jgi:hypothetical protein
MGECQRICLKLSLPTPPPLSEALMAYQLSRLMYMTLECSNLKNNSLPTAEAWNFQGVCPLEDFILFFF